MGGTCGNFSYEKTFIASVGFEFSQWGRVVVPEMCHTLHNMQPIPPATKVDPTVNVGVTNTAEN